MPLQSEYRQNYCGDIDGTRKENYNEMVRIRNKRKLHELRHTPIIWLDQEGNINGESKSKEVSFLKTEKIETPVLVEQELVPLYQCKSVQVSIEPVQTRSVGVQSPCMDKKTSDVRRSSRYSGRFKPQISHDKPVIAYGWADNTSIHKKKTFNVKAPMGAVRKSAIRAAKQKELQKHIRSDRKQKLAEERLHKHILINKFTNFNEWQTEYQKQFCN